MDAVPRISSALVAELLRIAGKRSDRPGFTDRMEEKCGLLLGRGRDILQLKPATNVAADPFTTFEIDPRALFAAHRAERRGSQLALLGYYHTHPSGDAMPSATDAACAVPDGRLWLIATVAEALLFRAVGGGAIHGRFDQLGYELVVGKQPSDGVGDSHAASGRHDGDDA